MRTNNTYLHTKVFINLIFILFSFVAFSQVGIGTTTPTETLDVDGNVKYSGALMPDNLPGTANEILLSGGANSPSVWGPELLNTSQTTEIGKFFSGLFNIPEGTLVLTLNDPNCNVTSTCTITWIGLTPSGPPGPSGPDWGELTYTVSAFNGYWIFYIRNNTTYNLINMQFSFLAAY